MKRSQVEDEKKNNRRDEQCRLRKFATWKFPSNKNNSPTYYNACKTETKNYEKAYLSEKICKRKYAKNKGIEKIINRTTRTKQ